MSNTNHTPNYDLPLFIPEDKPSWLGSWNDAMSKIDAGIKGSSQQGDSNATAILANKTAIEGLDGRVTEAEETIKNHGLQIQSLQTNSVVFLPYSTPSTYVMDRWEENDNNTEGSINKWSGGYLSVNITDAALKTAGGYTVAIMDGGVVLHKENGYFAASNTGLNVTSDPYLLPPNMALSVLVSVNNAVVDSQKIEVYNTPYRAYPMAIISPVNPTEPPENGQPSL